MKVTKIIRIFGIIKQQLKNIDMTIQKALKLLILFFYLKKTPYFCIIN